MSSFEYICIFARVVLRSFGSFQAMVFFEYIVYARLVLGGGAYRVFHSSWLEFPAPCGSGPWLWQRAVGPQPNRLLQKAEATVPWGVPSGRAARRPLASPPQLKSPAVE